LNILELAEEYYLLTFAVVIGIGLLQGAIIGRGIRSRFPSFKKHARAASTILLVFFSINAIASILKFAEPVKVSTAELTIPTTVDEIFSLILSLLCVNAELGAVIAIFVTITLTLFLKLANIHQIIRYFIFVISCIVLLVALLGKFIDFVNREGKRKMDAFYLYGITLGLFLVTRRKDYDVFSDLK